MKIVAADVPAYIAQTPPVRQSVLNRLRNLCLEVLAGYEECLEYGMPCYRRGGKIELSFASQKQYISLYVLNKEVLDQYREALAAASIGKGCVRFKRPEDIDFAVIRRVLIATRKSKAQAC